MAAEPRITSAPDARRTVVLYDGACPLCRREIAHYRRLDGDARVDWVDIATTPDLQTRFGVRREDALARMHVRDAAGRWHTGAAAFVAMWQALPGYRHLAGAVSGLRLTAALERLYTPFARWRLRHRGSDPCDTGRCTAVARPATQRQRGQR